MLSIVVPVYNVREYLGACLDSLQSQDVRDVEIVVVDDGSTDGSARIARKRARSDPRIRVVSRPNGGLSAARNTGTAAATAPFLTFVDSDDLVLPHGFGAALDSLQRSDADFALLPYRRFRRPEAPMPMAPWIEALYSEHGRTITAHDHPEVLVHATAWAKVYRRDFWDRAGLRFREGVLYEDQEVTAHAFVAAGRIDLVPVPAYLWRRSRPGSITNEASATSVAAFLDAARLSLVALDAVPGARAARASQLLCNDVPRYLALVDRFDDPAGAERLFDEVALLLAEPDLDLDAAPVGARVVYALVAADRRRDAVSLIVDGGLESANLPGDMVDGRPALRTPFGDDPDVPPQVRVLTPANTPLDARVLRIGPDPEGMGLTLAAWLRHLEQPPEQLRAWWVVDGERVAALTVTPGDEFIGHRLRTTRAANDRSVWRATGAVPPGAADAVLEVEVNQGDLTAMRRVSLVDESGSAGRVQRIGDRWWDPAAVRLVAARPAPMLTPTVPQATEVTDSAVLVGGRWHDLPAEVGDHEVAAAVDDRLALRLPIDLPNGWLGLRRGALVWHRLPDVPREQLTVWWRRDRSVRDGRADGPG